jgi:polyisoprenoid-binding protein YceI
MSTWKIDPAHTDVQFSAKHLMVTNDRGTFYVVEGELDIDEHDPTSARGEIRIGNVSLSTGSEQRDGRLRSADFFDAEAEPWITARLVRVEPAGERYRVYADVTIRGITGPVVLDGEFLGIVPNLGGGRHAGFELSAKVDREDWGLTWNLGLEAGGWLVSKEVSLLLVVAADEVAAAVGATSEGAARAAA